MSSASTPVSHGLRGRREQKKHVTRQELLAAGRRLFGEKGLYESSIEDLSRHAGVAKGTLYGYFASKDELVEAVVTAGFTELRKHSQAAVQGARTYSEVVAGVVEAHLAFFAANPDLMRVFHQVRGLLKFKRPEGIRLRAVLAAHLEGIASLLATRYPIPEPADGELFEAASLLFGAVSGIVSTRASLDGSRMDSGMFQRTVRAIVALVVTFAPADVGSVGLEPRKPARVRPKPRATGSAPVKR